MDDTRKSLWKYSYGSYTIQNSGTLVINNGTIENVGTTDVPYPIDNNSTSRDVITTINGGNIVSEKAAIRAYCNSTSNENRIIINGGNITGGTSAVWVS